MRKLIQYLLLTLLLIVPFVSKANVPFLTPSLSPLDLTYTPQPLGYTYGMFFALDSPRTITHLGFVQDPLLEVTNLPMLPTFVGLWTNYNPIPIASAVVLPTDPVFNGYHWSAITPVTIEASDLTNPLTYYVIAAVNTMGYQLSVEFENPFNPEIPISLFGGKFSASPEPPGPFVPIYDSTLVAEYIGANIMATPEPSTYLIMGSLLAISLAAYRYKTVRQSRIKAQISK